MDKQTHRYIILAGLGFVVLGAGACNKAPDEVPAAPVPVSPKQVGPQADTAPSATSPGAAVKQAAGPGKGSRQAKGSKTTSGSPPMMARGNGDPFAPAGTRPGGAANTRPGGAPPAPPQVMAFNRRKDPFLVDWKLPVPPPYVFDEVEPIRLASDAVETPPTKPFEVREQPEMRVSGIMTGDGVFAILESGGDKVDVVKPGSTVEVGVEGQTKRTYKVVSITKDKVRLRSQVGNVIYTQEVPLSDVAVGTPSRPSFGGPGGMPGSFGPGASFGPGGSGGAYGPGRSSGPGGSAGSFGPGGGGKRGGSGAVLQ